MRYCADPLDPGFALLMSITKHQRLKVYLNGVVMDSLVHTADDQKGEVVCFVRGNDGILVRDTKTLYGPVNIEIVNREALETER